MDLLVFTRSARKRFFANRGLSRPVDTRPHQVLNTLYIPFKVSLDVSDSLDYLDSFVSLYGSNSFVSFDLSDIPDVPDSLKLLSSKSQDDQRTDALSLSDSSTSCNLRGD